MLFFVSCVRFFFKSRLFRFSLIFIVKSRLFRFSLIFIVTNFVSDHYGWSVIL